LEELGGELGRMDPPPGWTDPMQLRPQQLAMPATGSWGPRGSHAASVLHARGRALGSARAPQRSPTSELPRHRRERGRWRGEGGAFEGEEWGTMVERGRGHDCERERESRVRCSGWED